MMHQVHNNHNNCSCGYGCECL